MQNVFAEVRDSRNRAGMQNVFAEVRDSKE